MLGVLPFVLIPLLSVVLATTTGWPSVGRTLVSKPSPVRSAATKSAALRHCGAKAGSVDTDWMRSSENKRSRLASRSRSTRSRTAGSASSVLMMSPSQNAAERAAHDGFADIARALGAGLLGEFRRHLRGDAGHHRARHIARHRLRCRQRLAARTADAEQVLEPKSDAMKEADMRRRCLAGVAGRARHARARRRQRAAFGEPL